MGVLSSFVFSSTVAEESNSFMVSVCTDVSTIHAINLKCVYDDVLLLFLGMTRF